jgi:hypothetical protein
MGTTQMFYGLSLYEYYYKDRISVFVALAPVTKLTNTMSKLLKFFAKYYAVLYKLLK